MKANLMNKKIEMTKTEAAAAGTLNSDKYKELQEYRAAYPGFEISIVKSTAKQCDRFKGLTCEYMEKYIKTHKEELLTVFYQLRGLDENGKKQNLAPSVSYGELKMWFLTQFSEIEKMAENVEEIIKKTRETRQNREAEQNT